MTTLMVEKSKSDYYKTLKQAARVTKYLGKFSMPC